MAASGSSTTNLRLRYDVGGARVHYTRYVTTARPNELDGEDARAVVCDGHGVLPVCGARTVGRDDGPLVLQHDGLCGAEREHRFDGQHGPRRKVRSAPRRALVGQERVHVHLSADAVSAIAGDDAELSVVAGLRGVRTRLDGMRDVGEPVAGNHGSDACFHRLTSGRGQRFVDGDQRTDAEGDGRVAVPTVEDRAAVDGHQITGGQYL